MKIMNYDFFNATNYFTLFESDKKDITPLIDNKVCMRIVDAPFTNWQIKSITGLKYLCCQATK